MSEMKSTNEIKIVKELMTKYKKSSKFIAEKLYGAGTPPSKISNRLQSKTMNVETLIHILDVLDCELIIHHKAGDKETYIVNNEERCEPKIYRKNEEKGGEN